MEFTYNRKSKGTLEDLQQKFQEEQEREREEERLKQLEYDRKYGFKELDEILTYLKNGGVIGDYCGIYGEVDMTNDFLVWKNDHIIRRTQRSTDNDGFFWMATDTWDLDDFKQWLDRGDKYKNEEGYYPTILLHKNNITINDIDERLI